VSDAPEVMVIHDALLDAVHAHELAALTLTDPVAPDEGAELLLGSIA
jgi:hypothetical protein